MAMTGEIAARPTKFYFKYKTLASGETIAEEWCNFARPGMQGMMETPMRITEKVKNAPGWEVFEPYYEAWKKGQEMPETGTPLGAWPSLDAEQVAAFKMAGIRTVEDVAAMNDRQKSQVKLPGLTRLQQEARTFMDAKDSRAVELELQQLRDQVAALTAAREEDYGRDAVPVEMAAPKRRGRPPKAAVSEFEQDEEAA